MENTASDRFMRMTNVADNTVMGDGYGSGYGSDSGSGSGIMGSIFKVFALMVILALLGINIFYYLGDATEYTAYVMDPVYRFMGYETSGVVKQAVKTSAVGTKVIVDTTAGALNTSVDFVDNVVQKAPGKIARKIGLGWSEVAGFVHGCSSFARVSASERLLFDVGLLQPF